MRQLGTVIQVQIQRSSLKAGDNDHRYYDPTPLLVVESLRLSPHGVVGVTSDGAEWVDVHNALHPDTKNVGKNGISVSFSTHYDAMRSQFGPHLTNGIAGENVLVETSSRMELPGLGQRLAFQNTSGGWIYLNKPTVAAPCEPFSRFALRQNPPVPAQVMKSTLQFLGDGMRGFYAFPLEGVIQAGDTLFAIDE